MNTPAASFKRTFSPYLRRFAMRVEDMFGGTWRTAEQPLTDERIENAILGHALFAYFTCYAPRALGVDIDDHEAKGPAVLRAQYDAVRARFGGLFPSVVCRSPRGLHLWYLLHWPVPWAVIHEQAGAKLRGLKVELRPSPTLALRIPHEAGLLDPGTLLPLRRDFNRVVAEAPHYHPAELFNPEVMPVSLRADVATRRKRYSQARYSRAIAEAEAELAPVLPGNTNDALCRLMPLYRGAGLSEEESALRFYDLLAPFYTGELRDPGRLRRRVGSFYKRAPEHRTRGEQHGLFTSPIAEAVAKAVVQVKASRPGERALRRGQVQQTARGLAAGILEWADYVAAVRADPRERSVWCYLYPYFGKNTREGYVPMPRSVLRRILWNYDRYLPALVACGFLTPAPYPYVPGAGIARYYRVDRELFHGTGGGEPHCLSMRSNGMRGPDKTGE